VHLLNIYQVPFLEKIIPQSFLPKSSAEFADSLSILGSVLSPIALILALCALIIQTKQQSASNNIGALSVRQQYILSEHQRLGAHIDELKESKNYKPELFNNMVQKQKMFRAEAKILDDKIKKLIEKI